MRPLLFFLTLAGCQADNDDASEATDEVGDVAVPEFGGADRELVVVATGADSLSRPRDLDFHPDREGELWVVNQDDDSTTILIGAGTADQEILYVKDVYGNHFMEEVSAIAMGADDTFGTCQESRNTYDHAAHGNDFMGPALWSSDLEIYGQVNQDNELLGSHLDMLHESPWCMGIAHDVDNVFWIFDGLNGDIVRYDFQVDHGPGYDDHADGIIHRYVEATVDRLKQVPSHLELDHESGWLYYVDTGAKRVMRLDTGSGEVAEDLEMTQELIAEYVAVREVSIEVFVSEGLEEPSGLAIGDGRLFVSDHATGEIVAYDLEGAELGRLETGATEIMGLALGPDGRLWFVDAGSDELVVVDP